MIAVECAARFRERVSKLATLGGYAEGRSVRAVPRPTAAM